MALAQPMIADCVELPGLREERRNVEFTQDSGDGRVHPTPGGYSPEWSADDR